MEPADYFLELQSAYPSLLLVKGRFDIDQSSKTLVGGKNNQTTPENEEIIYNDDEEFIVQSKLTGHLLEASGFKVPFSEQVTILSSCIIGYCAKLPNQEELIVHIKKENGAFLYNWGPCSIQPANNPTADNIRILQQCMSGEICESSFIE